MPSRSRPRTSDAPSGCELTTSSAKSVPRLEGCGGQFVRQMVRLSDRQRHDRQRWVLGGTCVNRGVVGDGEVLDVVCPTQLATTPPSPDPRTCLPSRCRPRRGSARSVSTEYLRSAGQVAVQRISPGPAAWCRGCGSTGRAASGRQMPGLGGPEVSVSLHCGGAAVPVIVVTARDHAGMRQGCSRPAPRHQVERPMGGPGGIRQYAPNEACRRQHVSKWLTNYETRNNINALELCASLHTLPDAAAYARRDRLARAFSGFLGSPRGFRGRCRPRPARRGRR